MLHFRLFGQVALQADDGRELSSVLTQPKRLALLAYLAATRPSGFHRRDTLLALFWPELDQERGRAALRQALYTLRRALGDDVIVTRGDGEVGLNFEKLSCDVLAFRNALTTDPSRAVELYAGDMLSGFFISDTPEFERWLEEERWQLRREAAAAAWSVAESIRDRDIDAAANWAARAAALDPFNEEAVRRLMRLLGDAGHRASALQIYQNFARLLQRELETAPSAETERLAASLRITPKVNDNGSGHAQLEIDPLPRLKKSRTLAGAVLLVALLIAIVTLRAHDPAPTIAVGSIGGDPALRDMLATSLARIAGVRVISNTRILELSRGDTSAAVIVRAARRAGAERLLEGAVYRDANGQSRLHLQWVSLSDGRARQAAQLTERNTFALVDAATSAIAKDLDLQAPAMQFASVTTHSVQAYRLFEEGLRAYYREERVGAERLWRSAVQEDSTFAMALWYLSRLHDTEAQLTERALRHIDHASDRERLFVRTAFLSQMDDPRTMAVAETLAIRYPAEPDGHYFLGYAKMWGGDPLGAIPHFRTVIRMDTASLFDETALRCRACDALNEIGTALALADSGAALLRFAQDWIRVQPNSRGAWSHLTSAFEVSGQHAKAMEARRKTSSIPPANYADINIAETYMRAGDFRSADELLLDRIRHGDRDMRADAYFKYSLSLRSQGRYREAVHAAREFRRVNDDPTPIYSATPEGWALLASGEAKRAQALFDSIAHTQFTPLSRARNARAYVGALARVAEAAALSGDTVRLKQVIDTMQSYGRYTAFAPARKQHHFARGLLFEKRADHINAINEFRAALAFPVNVSTRIHLHLARELMAAGRAREAGQIAGSALRSSVGGAGYAVTHRELHELAAKAWRAAGVVDSARAHEQWLLRANPDAEWGKTERRR